MSDVRTLLERGYADAMPPPNGFERVLRRRDRKRRNQRIAAGVVGIAVFVASVWILTRGLSLDRSEKVVGPATSGTTGPAETAPVETAPTQTASTSAAPDVASQRLCSGHARSRLELTDMSEGGWVNGGPIRVRYEIHRSPVGHAWRIAIRRGVGSAIFRGVRMASDTGQLAVQIRVAWPQSFHPSFTATAVDTQTGQVCTVDAGL
jgi:hypothetical protein